VGVSLAWIGIQAMTAKEVDATLGLTETGSHGIFYEFPIAGLALPNGWYLLTAKPSDHAICSEPFLSELSTAASVVACSIEEHVMFASAAFWRDGREVWSVQHQGDKAVTDLVVKGVPPSNFEDLRARCFAAQESAEPDDVDYVFDIPLDLAKSIVGFRHDQINPEIDDTSFRALAKGPVGLLAKVMKPKWKFW
jgi:hypothetical protein